MINEEVVNDLIIELRMCTNKIFCVKKMLRHADTDEIWWQLLNRVLVKLNGDYRLIQELLCLEYDQIEINHIKSHLNIT